MAVVIVNASYYYCWYYYFYYYCCCCCYYYCSNNKKWGGSFCLPHLTSNEPWSGENIGSASLKDCEENQNCKNKFWTTKDVTSLLPTIQVCKKKGVQSSGALQSEERRTRKSAPQIADNYSSLVIILYKCFIVRRYESWMNTVLLFC